MVIADVFDACDAAHRFVVAAPGIVHSEVYEPTPEDAHRIVVAAPGIVHSEVYDSTPEEKHACETPVPTLVVSVVTLEEIGASSAQEVTVR